MTRALVLSALLLASAARAQSVPTLSLEEALERARTHQPQLQSAGATVEAAKARVDEARAPLLPQVSFTSSDQRSTSNFVARPGSVPTELSRSTAPASLTTYNFFNAGLSANQLVWDFNQTRGRYQAAEETERSQVEALHATARKVELGVRTTYSDAQTAKALMDVARQALENQARHLEQIRGFVELGSRPPIDLAQARTDQANAQVQQINAENAYALAKARLRQAIGDEGLGDFEVTTDVPPAVAGEDAALQALVDEALSARPELQALTLQARAAELTLRSVKGAYWPTLGVSASATEAGPDFGRLSPNASAAVNLSWPLYQGGLTSAQAREAAANLANLEAQARTLRQQIRVEVEQAALGVRAAKAALVASKEATENARQRLLLAEGRYQTGVGNAIELGDAQLALTSAQAQEVRADYQVAQARAQLIDALARP